jgi:hypothetical protein
MRLPNLLWALLACSACAAPADESDLGSGDGKADGSGRGFVEVNSTHTSAAFRRYVGRALTALDADPSPLAQLTLSSIHAGRVKIDEFADLTCADFARVRRDLPDEGLAASDYANLHRSNSAAVTKMENALDGYMWSNRIYVSHGIGATRLAATLIHEVNHVINRSEVGYYDDLPTSAFIHEYRAFDAERRFDPAEYKGIDLVDYVITQYELDRTKIHPDVLAHPLTPKLLPDDTAWRERRVEDDAPDVGCSP